MGEAIERLHGVRREVYLLTVRDGKSVEEAAKVLGAKEGVVELYRLYAIKFIEDYCKKAMRKGRL